MGENAGHSLGRVTHAAKTYNRPRIGAFEPPTTTGAPLHKGTMDVFHPACPQGPTTGRRAAPVVVPERELRLAVFGGGLTGQALRVPLGLCRSQ